MSARGSLLDVALLTTAVALGVALVWTAPDPTTSELEARKDNVLSAFDRSQVTEIRLSSASQNQATTVLRRKGGAESESVDEYLLGEEGDVAADRAVVSELLNVLEFATFERRLSEDSSGELGLETPQAELRVKAGPRSFRLLVGKNAELPEGAAYAQIQGPGNDMVCGVISAELLLALKQSAQTFRGSQLFPVGQRSTQQATLKRGREHVVLTPQTGGFFLETDLGPRLADRGLVDLFFFHLSRAKIEKFLEPNVAQERQKTQETVQITLRGPGASYDVTLGGDCPDEPMLMLANSKAPHALSGCVSRTLSPALVTSNEAWQSRRALYLRADEIDHVITEEGTRKLDLLRKDAGYVLVSRKHQSIPSDAGDDFLEALSDQRLEPVLALPEDAQPLGTLVVTGQVPQTWAHKSQGPTVDLVHRAKLHTSLGKGGELFVTRDQDGAVFLVPEGARWAFRPSDSWARDRSLLKIKPSEIHEVELLTSEGFSQKITRTEAGLILGDGTLADRDLGHLLFEELAHLSAERFLEEQDALPAGVTQVKFLIEADGKQRTETLSLGARVRGGYLAWTSLTEGSFVLHPQAKEILETPLTDRSRVTLKPEDLLSLHIKAHGRTYEFRETAGELRASGGDATERMVAPLIEALRQVQVLSASYGSGATNASLAAPRRGEAHLILSGRRRTASSAVEAFELCFGAPTAWRGQSAETLWLKGDSVTYLVQTSSLAALLQLL